MRGITWGLLAAWIVHDLEELLTMPSWSQEAPEQVRAVLPHAPAAVLDQLPMSRAEATTAIGLTGLVMAAAAASGARTGGRSKFFQASLAGFGLHAGTHLAQSAVLRRYTPGLVTTPLVVIPYSVWARRRLKRSGVPIHPSDARLNLLLAAVVPAAHAVARLRRLRRAAADRPTMEL
ncbi:HXXEE domain-containing protein [Kribbella sp. CA-294648]|uniref:HXXEE domain-containing protein n=1 Tax=Kribbella sp. CA-294648 TaxID=3239948 RepID=UPI003D941B52